MYIFRVFTEMKILYLHLFNKICKLFCALKFCSLNTHT